MKPPVSEIYRATDRLRVVGVSLAEKGEIMLAEEIRTALLVLANGLDEVLGRIERATRRCHELEDVDG